MDKWTTYVQGNKVHFNHEAPAIWDGRHHGVWCLYGHSHGHAEHWLESIMPGRFSLDVGIDHAYMLFGQYRPFTWTEITEYMAKRPGFGLLKDRGAE